jgi:hypothetical protein
MRSTKRDAPIDPARAAEFLDVDPSHQAAEAVTNEIYAATSDMPAEVLTQGESGSLDPSAGIVIAREDLLKAAKTKVRDQREENGSVCKVTVHDNDGPLISLARGALARALDAERK